MRACTLVLATVALMVAAAPASAAELPITARDVPGMRAAGTGKQVALRALGTQRPKALRRATRSGAVFANGKRRLTIGVFTLRSAAAAKRVPAAVQTRVAGGTAQAVVRRRAGRAIVVVRYAMPGKRTARALQVARVYAASQAAKVRRLLAQTAWERTLGEIRRDGTYSTATALRAFALAYGPLPGVKLPRGRRGVLASGTAAIDMIASKWASLTPAQRIVVERALGARHAGPAKTPPRARAAAGVLTPAPEYQAVIDQHAAFFTTQLPGAASLPIKAFKYSEAIKYPTDPNLTVLADALVVNDQGGWGAGTPAYCRVRVPPAGQPAYGTPNFSFRMAHEVFHCFEKFLRPAWSANLAPWIGEGLAEWAAIQATGWPASKGIGWYGDYLSTADAPLFGRHYDAVGFWGRAHELDDLWVRIPAVVNTATNGDAFAASGATQQAFVDTWASATWRVPLAGDPWYQQQPYAIPHEQHQSPVTWLFDDAPLASDSYAQRRYGVLLEDERPLVHVVKKAGSLRAGSPKKDFGKVESQWFCHGTCACPPATGGTIPAHEKVPDGLMLGLSGGSAAGAGQVSFHSLDEFCDVPTGVKVSGATEYKITQPAFCIATPDSLRVEIAWNEGGEKQAHVTIEVSSYKGFGSYGATVTAYDYRSSSPQHQWGPGPGSVTVTDPGNAHGFGATGTVSATLQFPGEPPTQVSVEGSWSCTRDDSKGPA